MAYDYNNGTGDTHTHTIASLAEPVSLSAWINGDDMFSANFIAINNVSGGGGFRLGAVNDGLRISTRQADGTEFQIHQGTLVDGVWTHVGAVFASSSDRRSFLNGTKFTDTTTSGAVGTLDQVTMGSFWEGSTAFSAYDGRLAECAAWNVALNDNEMLVLAAGYNPLAVRPDSLIFYAPLIRDALNLKGTALSVPSGAPAVAVHPRVFSGQPRRRS